MAMREIWIASSPLTRGFGMHGNAYCMHTAGTDTHKKVPFRIPCHAPAGRRAVPWQCSAMHLWGITGTSRLSLIMRIVRLARPLSRPATACSACSASSRTGRPARFVDNLNSVQDRGPTRSLCARPRPTTLRGAACCSTLLSYTTHLRGRTGTRSSPGWMAAAAASPGSPEEGPALEQPTGRGTSV